MNEQYEEDIFVDVKAIGEKYEEKGYFRRLKDMFDGLGKPHNTPEYKLAKLELQRLQAPLIAVVSVVLFIVILIVLSQMKEETVEEIVVTQVKEPDKVEEVEEEPPPPPPDPEPITPEIEIDVPNPGPQTEITPVPSPPSKQVSTKPAPENQVSLVQSPVKMKSVLGGRNPGAIGAATSGGNGYGDPTTEICVLKVLWWLKATQNSDGSWGSQNKLANTALGVLTYLAHGEFPGSDSPHRRDFGPVMKKALEYLIRCVDVSTSGVKMKGADGNEYSFLIATYALCEAFGMTRNADVKDVAMECLTRIVKGQSPTGGWDYKLNPKSKRDDLSFAGWALQALKAGKMAELEPEGLDACIKKAIRCLKERNFKNGGFGYCAGHKPDGLTATGCLAMQLLGYGSDQEVVKSLEFMRSWKPAFDMAGMKGGQKMGSNHKSPQYYCYYATQCKYQAGMKSGATKKDEATWFEWNKAMKKLYTTSIIDLPQKVKDSAGQEHRQGYFKNSDQFSSRPYMDSCLAALQLMVYYRYLPTTQTKAGASKVEKDDSTAEKAVNKGDVVVDVEF